MTQVLPKLRVEWIQDRPETDTLAPRVHFVPFAPAAAGFCSSGWFLVNWPFPRIYADFNMQCLLQWIPWNSSIPLNEVYISSKFVDIANSRVPDEAVEVGSAALSNGIPREPASGERIVEGLGSSTQGKR